MNIEKLLQVRAAIEAAPAARVDQRDFLYQSECGTVGCIAGWTFMLSNLPIQFSEEFNGLSEMGTDQVWDYAEQALGLTREQATELFRGDAASFDEDGTYAPSRSDVHKRAVLQHIDRFIEKHRQPMQSPIEECLPY